MAMAEGMRCREVVEIVTEDEGTRKRHRVRIGCRRVRLPKREEWLTLVVVKGFGEKPMLLFTDVEVKGVTGGAGDLLDAVEDRRELSVPEVELSP